MKQKLWIGVVVAVIIVIGAFVLIKNSVTPTTMNMSTSTNGTASHPDEAATVTDSVSIKNFAFTPATITVKKGTMVTWTNDDITAHTVTESDGQTGPDSQEVNPGSTYGFTFNQTGTFQYHCTIHPSMMGSVIVTD